MNLTLPLLDDGAICSSKVGLCVEWQILKNQQSFSTLTLWKHLPPRLKGVRTCGGLSTFRSLQELLSGLVSTNTTQILQARKQMECDNNEL